MAKKKKKILIASPDVLGPIRNGGVGTACSALAEILVANGYEVDILFTIFHRAQTEQAYQIKKWTRIYKEKGIGFHLLPPLEFEHQHWHHWVKVSYSVYEWLKPRQYNLVVFPDMFGVGYYSMMARQSGLAFQSTPMTVMFLGPQLWSREANKLLFNQISDLTIPMLERGSVEMADLVQFATKWSREWSADRKWKYRDQFQVLFPLPEVKNPLTAKRRRHKEIAFFGRLESRKGIEEFLDAIETMHANGELKGLKVTLLGSEGFWNGVLAVRKIDEWKQKTGIRLKLVLKLQSAEAIAYLRKNSCLAVIASRSETMGYTLLECLAHGIPFVCSDIEPFQEILGIKRHKAIFRTGDPEAIRKTLLSGETFLNVPLAQKLLRKSTRDWLRLIKKSISIPAPKEKTVNKVSVLVTHYNRPKYLTEALQSLLRQTVMPAEILIYDDASPSKRYLKVIEEFKTEFAKKHVSVELFQSKKNMGPGHGRNLLAEHAKSDFVLFMDDDNIALPYELELLSKMQATVDADVITASFVKIFDRQEDLWMPRVWTPVGFDPSASSFENAMGDANFLVRRKSFLEVGGFDVSPTLYAEDMHLLIRLAKNGANMWVCPEPLFLYRIHATNRSKDLELHDSRLRNLKAHLSHAAGGQMDSLAHVVLAWTYEKGFLWMKEPAPTLRKFNSAAELLAYKLSPKKIKQDSKRLRWSALELRKECGLKKGQPFYIALLVKSKGNGKLISSNQVQEFNVVPGVNWITVGVPKYEDQCEIKIVGKASIQIQHLSLAPVPESKMLKRLLPA